MAVTIGGNGSEFALAVAAAIAKAPAATVYGIVTTEATGVKAATALTVAGVAGGSGTVSIRIHGVVVQASILAGDSANTAAATIAAAINARGAELCVTASVSTAVVTIAYRHNGTRGNAVIIGVSAQSSITTQTYTLAGSVLGATTAGTGTDSLTAALATAAVQEWDYITPANTDLAAVQALQVRLKAAMGPLVRKRGVGVVGFVDTMGACTTIAQTINEGVIQLLWHKKGEDLPVVFASAWAANRAVLEQDNPNVHLSIMNPTVVDLWPFATAPAAMADYITPAEANAALDVGLTPLLIGADSHPRVALSITSHSQDALGAPDTRLLTTNMVTVTFAWMDRVDSFIPTNFPGMNLMDDPVEGADPLPPNTVTPSTVKTLLANAFINPRDFGRFVDNPSADVARWAFNIDPNNPNRMNATMPLHPIEWFTQFSYQAVQQ
jgi:phage tail sheath gpL-like